MLFSDFSLLLEKIEQTSSRNEITEFLVEFISKSEIRDVQIAMYLIQGRVAPLFVDSEFNFSEKSLLKVFKDLVRQEKISINTDQLRNELGDIGLVASELFNKVSKSRGKKSLHDVYENLWSLTNAVGTGSQAKKTHHVLSILHHFSPLEAKYYSRIVAGKLRLGASDRTVLDSLSFIFGGDKSNRDLLDDSYGVDPDLGLIAYNTVLKKTSSKKPMPTVGVPVFPRLVERVQSFEEVIDRLGDEFFIQPKFDGLRCQVHKGVGYKFQTHKSRIWIDYLKDGSESGMSLFGGSEEESGVKIFSRKLEDLTQMFPDVVDQIKKMPQKSFILDCEVVGWDEKVSRFATFQETMTRKRKYAVSDAKDAVPVQLHAFDIIELNGKSLIPADLEDRIKKLKNVFAQAPKNHVVKLVQTTRIKSVKALHSEFEKAVSLGLEGIIAKSLKGGYQPGKRNFEWLKLKRSMDKKLVDTVDVVIMGYYYGSGKKVDFGMGALLGGVYNSETETIESVTKIGTGITDEQWRIIAERVKLCEVEEKPKKYSVSKELYPDVWLSPEIVCAVEADEITVSKIHRASRIDGAGLALRFPRLLDFDRDKRPENATWSSELRSMYEMRFSR
ncbi:ATP-dependent DNA ligase [Candidatus Nomurabacteria bacterium]|nr:ATP-dependent DNA ligase [Candidatus Nomurabacteria bacterium]